MPRLLGKAWIQGEDWPRLGMSGKDEVVLRPNERHRLVIYSNNVDVVWTVGLERNKMARAGLPDLIPHGRFSLPGTYFLQSQTFASLEAGLGTNT